MALALEIAVAEHVERDVDLLQECGARVRSYRKRIKLPNGRTMSGPVLARRVGVSKGTISALESGKVWVRIPILARIATELGVPVGELLTPIPESPPLVEDIIATVRKFDPRQPQMLEVVYGLVCGLQAEQARALTPSTLESNACA